jgi:hypothetical protein
MKDFATKQGKELQKIYTCGRDGGTKKGDVHGFKTDCDHSSALICPAHTHAHSVQE